MELPLDVIATLIAADRLDESDIRAARALLDAAGIEVARHEWVERGSACDLFIDAGPSLARAALEGRLPAVDVVVQARADRTKRLLVADMDSTMIEMECIDELADYAGLKAEVAAVTEAAMRGELDFEASLTARVRLLAGMDVETIDRCRAERIRFTSGASTLVRTMKAKGARTLLVSGGFTRFAEPVAAALGFDRAIANVLEIAGDRLSGTVRPPIVGAETKREALVAETETLGTALTGTIAVGDGANDIPMLQAAGLGVAYRAKPAAKAAAGAVIDHNDLTALLYAQGIPRSQWVVG